MQFAIEQRALVDKLSIVERAIPGKVSMAILDSIYLGKEGDSITLRSNNLEMAINVSVEGVDGLGDGKTVLPKQFIQAVKQLPGPDINIQVEKNIVTAESGSAKFRLSCADADDFPVDSNDYAGMLNLKMKGSTLKNIVRKTAFCIADDIARPLFRGMLIQMDSDGKLLCYATDTYRLAKYESAKGSPSLQPFGVIVPGRMLLDVAKIVDNEDIIDIYIAESNVTFIVNDCVISVRLVDGKFPNIDHVFPSEPKTQIAVERQAFINAMDRVRLISNNVSLSIADSVMGIVSESDTGRMDEELPVTFEGEAIEKVIFNAKFWLEGAKAFDGDELRIKLHGDVGPAVIEEDNYKYLVLPIKLNR